MNVEENLQVGGGTAIEAQGISVVETAGMAGEISASGIAPSCGGNSSCGCGGKSEGGKSGGCGCGAKKGPTLGYVIGQIGFDLVSEARRDSLRQSGKFDDPDDPKKLVSGLDANPEYAQSVYWTLNQEDTPIYAIMPGGPFAKETYARIREFYAEQIKNESEQVSIPGYIMGSLKLMNGQSVPMLVPELRGMRNWTTAALVKSAGNALGAKADKAKVAAEVSNFLVRVYNDLRNLGVAPQERALNFAATNAFEAQAVFADAISLGLRLNGIEVVKSPICRPESDCWDVKLTFFDPLHRLERANEVYRYTVDVSDVVPVTIGKVRHWSV
jgi:cyanobactin maturation PatA/PatG family protease